MELRDLPALNAILNAASALLLAAGWVSIRRGRRRLHQKLMLAAFAVSVIFLASYLFYHAQVGSVRFQRSGAIRTVYLTILLTHSVLAAMAAPMVLVTVWRAATNRFDRHRAIARWTLPVWLYVSVTGVVVYWMLYRL